MIRFLQDRMGSISSDLLEEILKPKKGHPHDIIQIVPCKATFNKSIPKIFSKFTGEQPR